MRRQLNPDRRLIDIAVQFVVVESAASGLSETGARSPVYGGCYDIWRGEYVGTADHVEIRYCSDSQLDFILDDHCKTEGAGGRGGGKSVGGCLKLLRHVVESPARRWRALSPTFKLTRPLWRKFKSMIPRRWLMPGSSGIRQVDWQLNFIHNVLVQFNSATDPDSLRSDDFHGTLVDEAQDVSTEAIDIAWFCHREADRPRLWMALTPKPGEAFERHKQYVADDEARCIQFGSYSNPFTPKATFDLARRDMDADRFAIEVDADWTVVERLAETGRVPHVFPEFNRDKHCIHWRHFAERILKGEARDLTSAVTRAKAGKARQYIIGIDPNWDYPNYSVVWKVISPAVNGAPRRWVAIDVVSCKGNCEHLGRELKRLGYNGNNSLLVPDASARYNRGKRSSANLLRKEGFGAIILRSKNPEVWHSVDAVQAKVNPADGAPSLFVAYPSEQCKTLPLIEALEQVAWDKSGKRMDKSTGVDHVVDAMRYPVDYFEPAAERGRRIRGIV